jgi:FkbM family methyltransferase
MGASPDAEALELATGDYGEIEGAPSDRVVFGTYRETGTWSPELVALLSSRLLSGGQGTLLDVGANIGLIAIAVAQRSRAHCLAFEPVPANVRVLTRNIARHGLGARIEVHPIALDARPGRVTLAMSHDNSGDHRIVATAAGAAAEARVEVQAERLDDVLTRRSRALARPCVLKLDTQGAEARVLRGAARTLEQVDALIVEYWPAGLLRAGDSAAALHALLAGFPYAAVLGQPLGALQPTAAVLESLAWVPADGSDEGFLDVLLARERTLPGG